MATETRSSLRICAAALGLAVAATSGSSQGLDGPPRDAAAYYPFDGNALDAAGQGRDGSERGGVSYAAGRVGQAVRLNGSDAHVVAPALNPQGSLTVTAWALAERINPDDAHTVLLERARDVDDYCGPSSAGTYELQIYAGRFAFATSSTNATGDCLHPRILADWPAEQDRFYCLAGVFDQETRTMSLYVDGELMAVGTTYEAMRIRSDAVLRIGRNSDLAFQAWTGLIDEVKVFSRALSPLEIQDLCRGQPHPVVDAGDDQSAEEGELVVLDGTASQAENATFYWEQVAGPGVALSGETTATPTFVAPWLSGGISGNQTLTFRLTVSSNGLAASATVNVTIRNVNHPPVADAGPVQFVAEGSPVTLSGLDSYDPDGDPVASYVWEQTAGPFTVVLQNADTAQPTFTAPLLPGGLEAAATFTFRATVSDGVLTGANETTVTVEQVNHRPVAEGGADQGVNEGAAVTLDGSGSADPDGDPIRYLWSQIAGPEVVLSDPTRATPSFTGPEVAPGGARLVFQLVVSDGVLASEADEVVVNVSDVNDPPLCEAARPTSDRLWPPNHGLVAVGITGVSDPQDDTVTVTIIGVSQDEPVDGLGDGDTSPDAVLDGGGALLRAERSGGGNGRVYALRFTAADGWGGLCTGVVTVGVPHSSRRGVPIVDDGQRYDSTRP